MKKKHCYSLVMTEMSLDCRHRGANKYIKVSFVESNPRMLLLYAHGL